MPEFVSASKLNSIAPGAIPRMRHPVEQHRFGPGGDERGAANSPRTRDFSAADGVYGSGLSWTLGFGLMPKRPEFVAYVARLEARPARKRAQDKDAAFKATLA